MRRSLAALSAVLFLSACAGNEAAATLELTAALPEKVMLPAEVIDKSNYKAWLVPVEQRACPDWAALVQ